MRRIDYYRLLCRILRSGSSPQEREALLLMFGRRDMDWIRFTSMASNHLVLPSVYVNIRMAGFEDAIPGPVLSHLEEVYEMNLARNRALLGQVEAINALLQPAGIDPLYIKGIAHLISGLYPDPGERIMQDIDLMVDPARVDEVEALLKQAGYASMPGNKFIRHLNPAHLPRLYAEGQAAPVEIHTEGVELKQQEALTAEAIVSGCRCIESSSFCTVIGTAEGRWLNFLHGQIHHGGQQHGKVLLRNLHEFFLYSQGVDPPAMLAKYRQYRPQLTGYLRVLRRDFGSGFRIRGRWRFCGHFFFVLNRLNTRSRLFSVSVEICIRMIKAYLLLPFRALTDRQLRTTIRERLSDPRWYGLHIRSYFRFFNRPAMVKNPDN